MCTGEIVKVSEPETDVRKGYLERFLKVMLGDKSVGCYSCGVPRAWTGITGNGKQGGF